MKKVSFSSRLFLGAYLLIALGCLIGRLVADPLSTQLDYAFKPLLMPVLGLYLFASSSKAAFSRNFLLLIALFFACAGDVFLMLGQGLFFLAGLGSFLVMQVLYILIFLRDRARPSFLRSRPFWALPFVLIGGAFFILSIPALKDDPVMLIAVFVYASALSTMAILSLNRRGAVSNQGFWLLMMGASLFFASDLMIGINKFIVPDFPLAGFWIMLTYVSAQVLVVEGYLRR